MPLLCAVQTLSASLPPLSKVHVLTFESVPVPSVVTCRHCWQVCCLCLGQEAGCPAIQGQHDRSGPLQGHGCQVQAQQAGAHSIQQAEEKRISSGAVVLRCAVLCVHGAVAGCRMRDAAAASVAEGSAVGLQHRIRAVLEPLQAAVTSGSCFQVRTHGQVLVWWLGSWFGDLGACHLQPQFTFKPEQCCCNCLFILCACCNGNARACVRKAHSGTTCMGQIACEGIAHEVQDKQFK